MNRRHHILIADDDPAVRSSLARLLQTEGYSTQLAGNGKDALKLVREQKVDLVLLDLNMPSGDGWTTYEQLTILDPMIPVVVITARANQLFTALASGVAALLEKPLDLPLLLSTIAQLLTEPLSVRSARMAGRTTTFRYVPPSAFS